MPNVPISYTAEDNARWFLEVMGGNRPEQVPISFGTGGDILLEAGPYDPQRYYQSIDRRMKAMETLNERFDGFPGWMVEIGAPNCAQFAAAFGAELTWNHDGDCFAVPFILPETIESLKVPDPWYAPVICKWPECSAYLVQRGHEPGAAWSEGPIDIAVQLMGATPFLYLLYDQPDLAHCLIRKTTDFILVCLEMQESVIGHPVPVTIGDDTSGYLTPVQFREFAFPYLAEIFNHFPKNEHRLFRIFHSDTDQRHNLDLIAHLPVEAFNCGPHDIMDMTVTKEKLRTMALIGNIKPTSFGREAPEDFEILCRSLIEAGGKTGGLVLAPGGEMYRGATRENLNIFFQSVEKYGRV